jgi:hypothetical protein
MGWAFSVRSWVPCAVALALMACGGTDAQRGERGELPWAGDASAGDAPSGNGDSGGGVSPGKPDVPAAPDAAPDVPAAPDAAPDVPAAPDAAPDVPAAPDAAPDVPAAPDAAPDVPAVPDAVPDAPPADACVSDCDGRECGPDGCGGECGTCPPQHTCDGAGQCECVPLSCEALGYACGSWEDGCGGATGECGTCPPQHTCDGAGQCECVPLTCEALGYACGSWEDGCGGATGECGTCPPQHTCDGAGQCECVPLSCEALGYACGSWEDGCGGATGECGPCAAGDLCSLEGECLGPEERGYSLIPAGEYQRGAPLDEPGRRGDEVPHHVVLTRSFFLKRTPVTQAEWQSLMGNTPSYFAHCGGDCPVEQVAFVDALAFCNALSAAEGLPACYDLAACTGTPGEPDDPFLCPSGPPFVGLDCLGYRLPTEAEWEYAYRQGGRKVAAAPPHGKLSRRARRARRARGILAQRRRDAENEGFGIRWDTAKKRPRQGSPST